MMHQIVKRTQRMWKKKPVQQRMAKCALKVIESNLNTCSAICREYRKGIMWKEFPPCFDVYNKNCTIRLIRQM